MVSLSKSLAMMACSVALVNAQIPSFFQSQDSNLESICNKDESQNVVCFKDTDNVKYNKAVSVARLLISKKAYCTGWLFGSEGHMITNNHCINTADAAANTVVEFNAITPGCNDAVSMGSNPGVVVANSTTLLINDVILSDYGYLQASPTDPALNDPIYVAGHPFGKPKRISMIKDGAPGKITTTSYTEPTDTDCHNVDRLGYNLDTEGGSSGTPVLSVATNLVVGLHNCGGCKADTADYGANYAIKITEIVKLLQDKNLLPKDAVASAPTAAPTAPPTAAPIDAPTVPPMTPAPSPTLPIPPPGSCVPEKANFDFSGYDIASVFPRQFDDCCAECIATARCKVYVWTPFNGGTCWLKSAKGEKIISNGAQAASLATATPAPSPTLAPPPAGTCVPEELNSDFAGFDIGSSSGRQFDNCCAECANLPGCKLFVWTPFNDGTCWFKSAKGERLHYDGALAASVATGSGPTTPTTCGAVERQTDYGGEDIGDAWAPLEQCCDLCKNNGACNAYSWSNGKCYFKSKRAGTRSKLDVHSARVYKCSAVETNIDYVGLDVAEIAGETAEDCCAICRGYQGCQAFSFAHGICYLKSGKAGTRANSGVVSAIVNN
ncbi:hypothetical protein AC1031_018428 [Aphanomyces cochlioides]|nr:hypothetical protein AC1031_018428 [Aphanomyces cochlioides]